MTKTTNAKLKMYYAWTLDGDITEISAESEDEAIVMYFGIYDKSQIDSIYIVEQEHVSKYFKESVFRKASE